MCGTIKILMTVFNETNTQGALLLSVHGALFGTVF